MTELRVAIAGLGTVGTSLLQILADGRSRSQSLMRVVAVSARSRDRDRGVDLSSYAWWDDPVAMAREAEADVFVELMGGEDGAAKAAIEGALAAGKQVVTANKALIAKHGLALARLAEEHGAALRYEAAVAGGVPVIRALRDGLAGARVEALEGVLNGTCNFILGEMEAGQSYADALADAQRLGYAEADPSFDVGGLDAAQKLAILSALAFDAMPALDRMDIRGIEGLHTEDIRAAEDLGYRIKLVARAERHDDEFAFRVGPALVPLHSPMSVIEGSGNIVLARAHPLGELSLTGPGAGGGATAAAVAADLVTIARGATGPVFAGPASGIDTEPAITDGFLIDPYFLRVLVQDRPGVLARLTNALAEENVSVDTIQQSPVFDAFSKSRFSDAAEIVITTHLVPRGAARAVEKKLEELDIVLGPPSLFPILDQKD